MKDYENYLASDYYQKCLPKPVSQGALTLRTQHIKNGANHFDAVLFLSIHTHKHRANHSSVILPVRMRYEQTFQIVSNKPT